MQKKEFYRHMLPHFQQPGQAYFITLSLKNAIPKKTLKRFSQQLEILKIQIESLKKDKANQRIAPKVRRTPTEDHFVRIRCNQEVEDLRREYYSTRRKYIKA